MNTSRSKNRLIYLLFLMFIYIIAQLGWWAFLITRLTSEVYANDPRLEHRVLMVWGEGIVFALLLLIGFIFTYKSYLKELRLARQQRNFLLSVTHEFKTPIASLRLQLETIHKRSMTEEQRNKLLESSLRDIDRLNSLAENILTAARIDQEGFSIHRGEGDLSAYVRGQIDHLTATLGQHHSTVVDVRDGIRFSFDPGAMSSILGNLYENAVKYSPKGSPIHVSLFSEEKKIRLVVSDKGSGIDPSEKEKIFDKFFRSGNEDTRVTKGTGLGLYIVRHFVEQHNGTINAERDPKGGSRFTVEFKL